MNSQALLRRRPLAALVLLVGTVVASDRFVVPALFPALNLQQQRLTSLATPITGLPTAGRIAAGTVECIMLLAYGLYLLWSEAREAEGLSRIWYPVERGAVRG